MPGFAMRGRAFSLRARVLMVAFEKIWKITGRFSVLFVCTSGFVWLEGLWGNRE
jgi:hypothetical protein